MVPDTLLVIGLGPAGGSIAWSAMRAGVPTVLGWARERGDLVDALKAGAVHQLVDRVDDGLRRADLVVVALPGGGTELLSKAGSLLRASAVVTSLVDLALPASATILSAGLGARWASSHPLEHPMGAGFAAARPDAFRDQVVYVTPATEAGDSAAREVMHFWEEVCGARAVRLSAPDHDARIGWLDQLPRLLAVAAGRAYGAGGLGAAKWTSEARRLGELLPDDPGMAARALIANRDVVTAALATAVSGLDTLTAAIASGDADRLTALLEEARQSRRGSGA